MKCKVDIDLEQLVHSLREERDAFELVKKIDEAMMDTAFSVKVLGWLFESLTNDIPKKELITFLETGSEVAITEW